MNEPKPVDSNRLLTEREKAINQANPLPVLAELLMNENDFMSWVIEYAHLKRWLVQHTRPAWSAKGYRTPIQGDKGFFDLVLARLTPMGFADIYFVELKSQKGRLSVEQKAWLEALDKNPTVRCFVWKPSDRSEITELLE